MTPGMDAGAPMTKDGLTKERDSPAELPLDILA